MTSPDRISDGWHRLSRDGPPWTRGPNRDFERVTRPPDDGDHWGPAADYIEEHVDEWTAALTLPLAP